MSAFSIQKQHSIVRSGSQLRVEVLHLETRLKEAVVRGRALAAVRTGRVASNAAKSIDGLSVSDLAILRINTGLTGKMSELITALKGGRSESAMATTRRRIHSLLVFTVTG